MLTARQLVATGGLAVALMLPGVVTAPVASAVPTSPAAPSAVDPTLAKDLQFSVEEERMARDLYTYFADRYDEARPFSNIRFSEQRHTDAVLRLMRAYNVPDPGAGKPAGSYASPVVQQHYDTWKAQGDVSRAAAYRVGVDLEQRDIADLQRLIDRTEAPDAVRVFGNLQDGSRRHLAAYQRAVDRGPAAGRGPGATQGRGAGQGMQCGKQAGTQCAKQAGMQAGKQAGMQAGQQAGRGRNAGNCG